jgi:phosphate uptake regulator
MIRKIIRQGHNTLTITLPSEWVKRFNLKAGEEINLIERENGLFLSTERINKPSEITIDVDNLNTMLIWKYVSTAYRAGYDKIIVKFPKDRIFNSPYKYFAHYLVDPLYEKKDELNGQEFFHQLADRFIGFEIIDYGDDFCILKEIGQSTSKEFESSLRRIFLLLLHLSEGIIGDLTHNKTGFLDKVHNLDVQVDKFHDFCARVLNKTGLEEPIKSNLISTLIFLLELVGDEFKHLAVQLRKKNQKEINSKKIIESLNAINDELKIFYELNYQYDKEKMKALAEMNKHFLEKVDSKKSGLKEDVQVTIESINRYIDVLSEILVARQVVTNSLV